VKKILVFALLALSAAAVSAPAVADPPEQTKNLVLPTRVVTGETPCGTLTWTINIVVDIKDFFDSEGNLVRQIAHVAEDNTIRNVTTRETFREGPDSFIQTIYFNPDGTVNRIVASGLQARVGNELMDVGRVVLAPLGGGRFDLVFSAGQHPVREAADDGRPVQDALPGFCALFE
jgi:hypothetical protein